MMHSHFAVCVGTCGCITLPSAYFTSKPRRYG